MRRGSSEGPGGDGGGGREQAVLPPMPPGFTAPLSRSMRVHKGHGGKTLETTHRKYLVGRTLGRG